MESFDIAKESSNSLGPGGVWSVYIWPDEDEAWYAQVEFTSEEQAGIVAFMPLGPFETAEAALLAGETEFYRIYYKDEMTLLLEPMPVQPSPDNYTFNLSPNGGIELEEAGGFNGNITGLPSLNEAVGVS